jgi:hypothetical protein
VFRFKTLQERKAAFIVENIDFMIKMAREIIRGK